MDKIKRFLSITKPKKFSEIREELKYSNQHTYSIYENPEYREFVNTIKSAGERHMTKLQTIKSQ